MTKTTHLVTAALAVFFLASFSSAQVGDTPRLFRTLDEAMASRLYEPVDAMRHSEPASSRGISGLACAQPPDGVTGFNANTLSLAETRTFPVAGTINELGASFIYVLDVSNDCPDEPIDPIFESGWQVRIYDVLPDGDIDESSVIVFDTDPPIANMTATNTDGGVFQGFAPIVDMRFDLTNGGANAGFAVEAGSCLAIQFRPYQFGTGDDIICSMFWETGTGGDGQVASDQTSTNNWTFCDYTDVDLMFCMDYVGSMPPVCSPDFSTPPANDECDSPMPIACDTVFEQCVRFATANTATDPAFECETTSQVDDTFTGLNTVWYSVTPPSNRVRIDTCDSIGSPNFMLQVFAKAEIPGTGEGPCDLVLIACSDNDCREGASICLNNVQPGEELVIQVGAATSFDASNLLLTVTCDPMELPGVPTNDECSNATQIFANPMPMPSEVATHFGNTVCASLDSIADCAFLSPGVWFEAVGDGTTWLLSLDGDGTDYETLLNVYCGECDGSLNCLETTEMPELLLCTEAGRSYYFYVTGSFDVGNFEFEVSADADSLGGCESDPDLDFLCQTCDLDCIEVLGGPPDINEETDAAALMEMCGNDVNFGCVSFAAPAFIEAGPVPFTACGKSDAEGPGRDLDAYRFLVEARSVVTFRLVPEFPAAMFLFNSDNCDDFESLFFVFGGIQEELVMTETLDPGTYVLSTTVDSFSGTPCAECNDYVLQVTASPFCPGDCDGDRNVNFGDLISILGEFGNKGFEPACDADGSGGVDFGDLVAALGVFGDCP